MKPGDVVKDVFITKELLETFDALITYFNTDRPQHSFPDLEKSWFVNKDAKETYKITAKYMNFFGLSTKHKSETSADGFEYTFTALGISLYSRYLLTREDKK